VKLFQIFSSDQNAWASNTNPIQVNDMHLCMLLAWNLNSILIFVTVVINYQKGEIKSPMFGFV
jgi:hypothetical protein